MRKVIPLQQPVASVKGTTTLNEQQLAAIQDLQGFHAINAGPGTGKSATLVARLQRIHEVYPSATLLMLAFSKAAAQELTERVGSVSGVTISTLHSLAYHVLKSSGWSFMVDTSAENQESAIESLISNRTKTTVGELVKSLHSVKGASRSTLRVRAQYLDMLRETHTVTFDTMIIFAVKVLRKHAGLRNYYQNKFDFVQVDEFQDLNPAQAELLKIMVSQSGNLCVSGDVRQQIYGFRGACGAMEEFSKVATIHEPSQAIRHVVKHGLDKYFGEARVLSIESAISELKAYPTISAFLQHVQNAKEQLAQVKTIAAKAKDVLTLSTIHTAKGCEYSTVFLIGLSDGVLPSSRDDADLAEEKRILYVGITRAKQRLYLSYPRLSDNAVEMNKPCRFIAGHF